MYNTIKLKLLAFLEVVLASVVEFKYVITHRVSFEFAIGTSKKCRNILEFSIIRIL